MATKKIFNISDAAIQEAVKIAATAVAKEQNKPFLYEALLADDPRASRFFKMLLGTHKVPAASVQAWGNSYKINPRGQAEVFIGEVNKIGVNYTIGEADLYDIRNLASLDEQEQAILGEMFADAKNGIFAVKQRIEAIFLQTLSSTKTILNSDNNPDGLVRTFDYQVPSGQKKYPSVKWSTSGSATGLADIRTWSEYMEDTMKVSPRWILMDNTILTNLLNQDSTKTIIFENSIQTSRSNLRTTTVALEDLNAYLSHFGLPEIVKVVDDIDYRAADGSVDETSRAWGTGKIAMLPSGNVGRVQYMPKLAPIGNPEYIETQSGIFTIKQRLNSNSDSEEMKTTVDIAGYPVLDRAHDILFANVESTSSY